MQQWTHQPCRVRQIQTCRRQLTGCIGVPQAELLGEDPESCSIGLAWLCWRRRAEKQHTEVELSIVSSMASGKGLGTYRT